jgi:uncharacterized protein (TIGR03083 family)
MDWLTFPRYAEELAAETERLATAVGGQPPDRVVPTCPEWTVRDLVTHVGTGHRYAAGIIEDGVSGPRHLERIEAPAAQAEWAAWLTTGAGRLTAAVREHGFDEAVWTWHPRHQTAGFWLRRMVHDLVVHRFDAELIDGAPGDLAADLAADGVDDLLLTFLIFDKLAGRGESLQFTATDANCSWYAVRTPGGPTWREGEAPADVTLAAPARDLLLVLNRRQPPGPTTGDVAVLNRWLEDSRF